MAFLRGVTFWLCFGLLVIFLASIPNGVTSFHYFSSFLILLRLAEWFRYTVRKFIMNPQLSTTRKAVLITGCDSGMGHEVAKRLDNLGYKVFAGCLMPHGDGAQALRHSCSLRLSVVQLDVTDDESVNSAVQHVQNNLGDNILWGIVNNAGIVQAGEVDWTPLEDFKKVMEVNTLGVVRVTKAFLPLLRQSKGRIVTTASACGTFICPGLVGYCMSKSAAIAFSRGLRVELVKWGVRAISLEPFFYKTPLTREEPNIAIIEKAWANTTEENRLAYGSKYLEEFKRCCLQTLALSSNHLYEVLDCIIDALGSTDPLDTYFPCHLYNKIGLKFFAILPPHIEEGYLSWLMPWKVKPQALEK